MYQQPQSPQHQLQQLPPPIATFVNYPQHVAVLKQQQQQHSMHVVRICSCCRSCVTQVEVAEQPRCSLLFFGRLWRSDHTMLSFLL
jgi:hypothetical protein